MSNSNLKPSDFTEKVWGSIFKSLQHETTFKNIMLMKVKNGDEWGKMSWKKYSEQLFEATGQANGSYVEGTNYAGHGTQNRRVTDKDLFKAVVPYTVSAKQALIFKN